MLDGSEKEEEGARRLKDVPSDEAACVKIGCECYKSLFKFHENSVLNLAMQGSRHRSSKKRTRRTSVLPGPCWCS